MVVRQQLTSSNPNFSQPRTRTANSDFWSRLTHQLLGRSKSTIPNLQLYSPKKANSQKLRLGIDNPCRIVFLSLRMNKCLERVNDRHFWNPGVFATQWYQDVASTQEFLFHCRIYSLWFALAHISHLHFEQYSPRFFFPFLIMVEQKLRNCTNKM
jgi:hypothetical protein